MINEVGNWRMMNLKMWITIRVECIYIFPSIISKIKYNYKPF